MLNDNSGKTYLEKIIVFIGRYIDYPMAFAGALIMGIIVGLINRRYGIWPATTAALKQAVYTFFFGGMLTRLLYAILLKIPGKFTSVILSALIVTTITVALVYLVHSMKGTPMPFESTLPTAIMAPFGFSFLAWRRSRKVVSR
jgi:hypothetical protein